MICHAVSFRSYSSYATIISQGVENVNRKYHKVLLFSLKIENSDSVIHTAGTKERCIDQYGHPTACKPGTRVDYYKGNKIRKEALNVKLKSNKNKGNFFLLPNEIFDEKMKARDFQVYAFLVSRKDSVGESWYSLERIADYCNMSVNTARRALHWLEEYGYIEIKKCFSNGVQKSNLYKVNRLTY